MPFPFVPLPCRDEMAVIRENAKAQKADYDKKKEKEQEE